MKRSTVRSLLLMVTIIWGSGYVVTDILLQSISAFQLITARFGLTFLMLAFLHRSSLKKIHRNTIKKGLILGGLLFFAFASQTVGLLYTTPSKNAFLTQVGVVLVPVISYFYFKQRVLVKTQIGIFTSLLGVAFMSLNGFGAINFGDFLSLLCALFFALQVIMMEQFIKEEEPMSLMLVQMGTVSILSLSITLFQGNVYLGGNLNVDLRILYLALFGTLFSYGVQTIAQKEINATEISLVLSLESFWGMMFSMVILKEVVSTQELFGSWLILTGVIISQVPLHSKKWKAFYTTRKENIETESEKS